MKKPIRLLQLLTLFAVVGCSQDLTSLISSNESRSSSSEITTSSIVTSSTTSSVISSSSSISTSSVRPDQIKYGKYVLKEGVTDTSNFNGSPWLNTHQKGIIRSIEKPSLKDDYFAYANYEYLQDIEVPEGVGREGGVPVANDKAINDALNAIYDDPKTGLPAINKAVRFGAKEAVNAEINRVYSLSYDEALAMFNSAHIFKGFSKFIQTLRFTSSNTVVQLQMIGQMSVGGNNDNPSLLRLIGSKQLTALADELYCLATQYGETKFTKEEITNLVYKIHSLMTVGGSSSVRGTVSDFKDRYDNIKFDEALVDAGFEEGTTILLDTTLNRFFTNLGSEISTNTTLLSKILALNKVLGYRFYLGSEDLFKFNEISRREYSGYLSMNNFPNEEELLLFVEDIYFDPYATRLYVDRYTTEESRQKVENMIKGIKEEYRKLFESYTWLGEDTKTVLIDKLDAMKYNIFYAEDSGGIPIGNIDYSNLDIIQATDNIEDYLIRSLAKEKRYNVGLDFPAYYTDALYGSAQNTFTICHGEGVSYLDKPNLSDEELYAYMGTVIGHEMTHGFDSRGSQYDKDGKKNDLWSSEDRARFDEKVQKLRDYMSENLVTLNGYTTNGENWDQEITADIGGLKLAYLLGKKKEGFDFDKFFKYYAHYFAYIATDDYILGMVNNSHPIGYIRVNFVLSQCEEFLNYYDIKEGDMMYTSPENIVAIW